MLLGPPFPGEVYLSLSEDRAEVNFRIDEAYPFFEGHFPGNPIVPAVAQIGWIVSAVEAWREEALLRYRLSRFKFVVPLVPGTDVKVGLTRADSKYVCRILADGILCCSGVLHVAQ